MATHILLMIFPLKALTRSVEVGNRFVDTSKGDAVVAVRVKEVVGIFVEAATFGEGKELQRFFASLFTRMLFKFSLFGIQSPKLSQRCVLEINLASFY